MKSQKTFDTQFSKQILINFKTFQTIVKSFPYSLIFYFMNKRNFEACVNVCQSAPLMYKRNSVRPRPGTSIILTKAIANLFRGNQSSNLRCRRSQTFYIMHGLYECVGRLQRRLPMQLFSLKILNVFHKALLQGFQK